MRSTGTNQHNFAEVAKAEIQRSSFNRSSGLKTTFDAGLLIPVFVDEALPGDTFNMRMHNFCRLATPIHPVMDNMHLDSFFFAVPIRLVWDNFQKMMGQQDDPGDSVSFLVPQIDTAGIAIAEKSLFDYMGIPTVATDLAFSALWPRAYNLIYNEFFRDQNLIDSVVVNKDDGPDLVGDYSLLKRGKRKDYFTSCLPWPQKGTSVLLPLGSSAPVVSSGDGIPEFDAGTALTLKLRTGDTNPNAFYHVNADADADLRWKTTKLEADLTAATAATINEIRQAFQVQKLLERDARGGTRYTEIIRSHFGVTSPDSRLQRPEYLGGGSQNISITPVPQTSSTDGTSPQGNLSGYGTSSGSGHSFNKSFTEHCVIIGMVCLRADLTYQEGMNRMWSRRTKYDFYWPALAHIGEQAVLTKEIKAVGTLIPGSDDLVFGYQERYAEYKYKPSMITADFRSNATVSLDTWHLAQEFDAVVPTLNETFINEDPPIDRIIAVVTEPHILFDAFFELTCARPMPTFSTPGLVDHF